MPLSLSLAVRMTPALFRMGSGSIAGKLNCYTTRLHTADFQVDPVY